MTTRCFAPPHILLHFGLQPIDTALLLRDECIKLLNLHTRVIIIMIAAAACKERRYTCLEAQVLSPSGHSTRPTAAPGSCSRSSPYVLFGSLNFSRQCRPRTIVLPQLRIQSLRLAFRCLLKFRAARHRPVSNYLLRLQFFDLPCDLANAKPYLLNLGADVNARVVAKVPLATLLTRCRRGG